MMRFAFFLFQVDACTQTGLVGVIALSSIRNTCGHLLCLSLAAIKDIGEDANDHRTPLSRRHRTSDGKQPYGHKKKRESPKGIFHAISMQARGSGFWNLLLQKAHTKIKTQAFMSRGFFCKFHKLHNCETSFGSTMVNVLFVCLEQCCSTVLAEKRETLHWRKVTRSSVDAPVRTRTPVWQLVERTSHCSTMPWNKFAVQPTRRFTAECYTVKKLTMTTPRQDKSQAYVSHLQRLMPQQIFNTKNGCCRHIT